MKLTPSELFTNISDGVFVFSGFISLLIGFSFGLLFNKLLTDQVEWVEFLLIQILFGKLPTIAVLGFLALRSSMLLQWTHLTTKQYQFVFNLKTNFILIFVWAAILAWALFNFFALFGFCIALEIANQGNSLEHIKSLLIDFDWTVSKRGLERLFFESVLMAILILFENKTTFLKFNDPAKGLVRSFLLLFSVLLILEFLDIYFLI